MTQPRPLSSSPSCRLAPLAVLVTAMLASAVAGCGRVGAGISSEARAAAAPIVVVVEKKEQGRVAVPSAEEYWSSIQPADAAPPIPPSELRPAQ
jgi:hypothetical protein